MVRLKHGLMCVSRTLTHALMSKKHTEGHALTYLKYVTIACFDLVNCDGEISGLGVTNNLACVIRYKLCLIAIVTYFKEV